MTSVMKKVLAIVTSLLLAGIAAGAQSFEGTFTQTRTLLSGKTIKSAGNISYTAPDQLAMIYTQPDGEYFIIDGPILRMDRRGTALDVNTDNNKTVKPQRNAILYSISGRYEEIAKEMDAECTVTNTKGGGKHVVIKARKAPAQGFSGLELDYLKNGQLQKMVLKESGGISEEYLLKIN